MKRLEGDLAQGVPLAEAAERRRELPEFYRQMLRIGAEGGDLAGVLTMVADYYSQRQLMWTRLKATMLYPILVLSLALVVCGLFTFFVYFYFRANPEMIWVRPSQAYVVGIWFTPALVLLAFLAAVLGVVLPGWRCRLRWRLPGFRDASASHLAASLELLLRQGMPLPEALQFVGKLESNPSVRREMLGWQERLASGVSRFGELAAQARWVPPLFVWLVASAGEDLAAGFRRAAELYRARALYRMDLMLYAALPVLVLVLGGMIVGQMVPLLRMLAWTMNVLGEPI